MRDVDRAILVMEENTELLTKAIPEMDEADAEEAKLYLDRIAQMEAMFRFAQLVITSILERVGDMDLNGISSIEIQ
jgi:serine/threonine-protein kinase RIO1